MRRDQRGQTIVIAAVGAGVLALVLLLVVNLGGVLLTLTGVQNTLRDAARAGALAGDGQGGEVYLDQTAAAEAAQAVFDVGAAQVSGWLADAPALEVEVLNPPVGACTAFGGGDTCYRRPAARLRTRITVNALLGAWAPVSFDLETVAAAGVGDPLTVSTPAPEKTPKPVSTEIVGASGTVWPTLAAPVGPTETSEPTPTAAATVSPTTTGMLPTATVGPTATVEPTGSPAQSPTETALPTPTSTLASPLPLLVAP